jgi:hypothetical protein
MRPPYGDVDDRVRAIVSALGYRCVLWNVDTQDTTATSSTSFKFVDTVQSWFRDQPGFISLEHDINPITSGIAINIINLIRSSSSFPLKPQSISSCTGDSPYYVAPVPVIVTSLVQASPSPTPAYEASVSQTRAYAVTSATSSRTQPANQGSSAFVPDLIAYFAIFGLQVAF